MLGWNQIVEVPRSEARQTLLDMLDEVGFTATSWQEGSIPLAMVEMGADLWSRFSRVAVFLRDMGFNNTSSGEALTRFSRSHYQNERQQAVPAQRIITLRCEETEGPHSIDVGDIIVTNDEGFEFRNVVDPAGEFPAAGYPVLLPSGGSLQLVVQADQPGTASDSNPGTVTTLVTTFAGMTIEEEEKRAPGVDEESDERLRLRNSLKWALLTRFGLIDEAVVALALNASEAVHRVRVQSSNPDGPGTFRVYVTGVEGAVGVPNLSAVKEAIQPYLMDPSAVQVEEAPLVPMPIAGEVYLLAEFEWENVRPVVLDALEQWRRTIPLGGFSYPGPGNRVPKNEIEHQIRNVRIGGKNPIRTVVLSEPVGDFVVSPFGHVTQPEEGWLLFEIKVID